MQSTSQGYRTLVQRKYLDAKNFELSDRLNQSILLEGSNVSEVNEIKPNWILLQVDHNILLLCDWVITKKFSACSPTDGWRFSLMPLPGLDHQAFPLILARSNKEISLLNLKLETMEKLIIDTNLDDATTPKGSFVIFKTSEDCDFKLHFVSTKNQLISRRTHQFWEWHCMTLSSDFEAKVREQGRLPATSFKIH